MRKLVIILVLIILTTGGWYFYNKSQKTNTEGEDTGIDFKSFFPFGNTPVGENLTGEGDTEVDTNEDTTARQTVSPFKRLTSSAVAGYTLFKNKNGLEVEHVLRYVSRNNGYVYEIKNDGIAIQISNIYAPNIYEAFFMDDHKSVVLRFLREDNKTIATYVVPVPEKNPDGTRTQKNGLYLPDGISSISASLDGSVLARLSLDGTNAVVSSTTSTNTNRKELFRSSFREWLVYWGGQKNIYLQTKASGNTEGFLYKVDTSEKRLNRVLGNIFGLTTSISPKGTYIIYSEKNSGNFTTKILTTKTGDVKSMGMSVLPEKCTWLENEDLICAGGGNIPEGVYPDTWYAGVTTFSDQVFRIYTQANIFDIVHTPSDEISFDMTNLQFDEDLGVLYFINKQSGELWQFTL